MPVTVSNRRNCRIPGAVYAGRPGPFGNPFVLTRPADRQLVVEQFKRWFHGNSIDATAMRKRAKELPANCVLECWCAPKPCHADVIAAYRNSLVNV